MGLGYDPMTRRSDLRLRTHRNKHHHKLKRFLAVLGLLLEDNILRAGSRMRVSERSRLRLLRLRETRACFNGILAGLM